MDPSGAEARPRGGLQPGDVLAGFRIDGVAGRGGMGVVHTATQLGLDRRVALKVIADALAADPAFRDRFVRESRAAASIDHPNVIPIFSAGEEDDVLFLAMRYVDGPDLRTLVRADGPLEPERAAHVVAQVGAALDAAHERGIVHRDVKPANVLLGAGDHAYLTDFGLTKRIGSHTGTTQGGGWVGTLGYVAPEQIRNERVDARTDVYALGCVLFHALTGRPPYAGDTDEALLFAHLTQPAPRPSDHGAPRAFDAVVARALAKEPAERYPSAGDLGRAALAAAGLTRAGAVPERTVARGNAAPASAFEATAVPGAVSVSGATAPTRAATARSRPAWAWALALVPIAALAALAAVILAGEEPPLAPATRGEPARTTTTPQGPSLETQRTIAVNGRANDVLYTAGRLWAIRGGIPRAALVPDRGTGAVRRGPVIGPRPTALASGFGRVWATNGRPATLTAFNARTTERDGEPIPLGVVAGDPMDVATSRNAVWVGMRGRPGYVLKIDPQSRTIEEQIMVTQGVQSIAAGYGAVWVTARRGNVVVRIDIATGDQREITVSGDPRGIATGADAVWVAGGDRLTRIDAGSLVTDTIRAGDEPTGVAVGERTVFVTNRLGDTVSVVDTREKDVVLEAETGNNPYAVDAAGAWVYVSNLADGTVHRMRHRRGE